MFHSRSYQVAVQKELNRMVFVWRTKCVNGKKLSIISQLNEKEDQQKS